MEMQMFIVLYVSYNTHWMLIDIIVLSTVVFLKAINHSFQMIGMDLGIHLN